MGTLLGLKLLLRLGLPSSVTLGRDYGGWKGGTVSHPVHRNPEDEDGSFNEG